MLAATILFIAMSKLTTQASANETELFKWFDSFGYTQYLQKPFVNVLSDDDSVNGKQSISDRGFLISEDSKSLVIVTLDLKKKSYAKTAVAPIYSKYQSKRADFVVFVKDYIKATKGSYANLDSLRTHSIEVSTSRGRSAVLAWICKTKGLSAEMNLLSEEVRKDLEPGISHVLLVKDEIAGTTFSDLCMSMSDKTLTRKDLLPRFRDFADRHGGTESGKQCSSIAKILEVMVAEDMAHVQPRNLSKLPLSKQIGELIWQLRDDFQSNGDPMMRPLQMGDFRPFIQLQEIGLPAVPQLIEALGQERLTRSAGFNNFGKHFGDERDIIYRVHDVVMRILEQITHRSLGQTREEAAKSATEWYKLRMAKGEKQALIEGTRIGDYNSPKQAAALAEKYPAEAIGPISEGYRKLDDPWGRASLVQAVLPLKTDKATKFLWHVVANDKDSDPRVQAIEILATKEPDAAVRAMLVEWNRPPSSGDHPIRADRVVSFLVESRSPIAFNALLKSIRQRPVDLRYKVISELGGRTFKTATGGDRAKSSRKVEALAEDILALELQDNERWNGTMGITIGSGKDAVSTAFSTPRMSEMACYFLNERFPAVYPFKKVTSFEDLEKQRISSLNIYRKRRGLAPAASSQAFNWPPIESRVVLPLINAVIESDNIAAQESILALGIAAYPEVIQAKRQAKGESQARLDRLARRISCIVRKVELKGAKPGPELTILEELREWENKVLTTERFAAFAKRVALGVESRQTRPAIIVASRDSNGSGFVISVEYRSEISQGNAKVIRNGESIREGGGGVSSLGFGTDDYLESGISRCLNGPPNTTLEFILGIDKPD